MNRLHQKNLRTMLGVSDPEAIMTDEVKSRIEQMETRMTRYYGRFMEMPVDLMACLVNDLEDKKVFYVPAPPKPTPEEYIAKMSRGQIEAELERRKIEVNDSDPIDKLRGLLLGSVKEKEPEKEAV